MSKFTLDISAVSPKAGPQFSPNLHAWLKKNFGKKRMGEPKVFRASPGELYVGYFFDGDFIGSKLNVILCEGARAKVFTYVRTKLRPVPSFWPKYLKVGRCHIDPKHTRHFKDTRWKEGRLRRTCLWCDLVQKKVTKKRVVTETIWVLV